MNKVRHLKSVGIGLSLILLVMIFMDIGLAQETIKIVDQSVDYTFRDHLTFQLEAQSDNEITETTLFYQIVGEVGASRNNAEIISSNSIETEVIIDQTDARNYLPPGAELEYWWKITDAEGNELKTERQPLTFMDNRYDWNRLENERLTLYWYEGDDSFGQAVFDRANEALDTLEEDVGVSIEEPIKIFVYGDHSDLLGAMNTSSQEWTGAAAFPDYSVMVIGVEPSNLDWGLGATTHEMTHLVIHQATDNPYADLPRWLDEGISVYNEGLDETYYRLVFEQAIDQERLMTLRSLSSPFPADSDEALVAYAQSGAVVEFIIDTHGTEAMAELLAIFSEGALYDEALEQALGVDTAGLDNAFREHYDLPPLAGTEETETVTESTEGEMGTENQEAEALEEATEEAPPVVEEEETEPATVVAESGTEAESSASEPVAEQQPEETEQSSAGGFSCLAGFLPLVILGWFVGRPG